MLQQARPGDTGRWFLLAVVMLGAWLAFEQLSAQLWFLPAGLRLGLLWLVPSRRWGWLAAAEVGAQTAKSLLLGFPILTPTYFASKALSLFRDRRTPLPRLAAR